MNDFDPMILNKWLNGSAGEEELREWLKSLYPVDMHDDIIDALQDDIAEGEDIDTIIFSGVFHEVEEDIDPEEKTKHPWHPEGS